MFQQGLNYEIMTRGWGKTEDPGYVKSKYVWKYMGVENSRNLFQRIDGCLSSGFQIIMRIRLFHMT